MTDFETLVESVTHGSANRERINLLVLVGNEKHVWDFDKELANAAKIGDTIPVHPSGRVVKIADDGWDQWRFQEDEGEACRQ